MEMVETMWVLYTIEADYDGGVQLNIFDTFRNKLEAVRLQQLAYDANRTPYHEWKNWIMESRKKLSEEFGLKWQKVPSNLEIAEVDIKD